MMGWARHGRARAGAVGALVVAAALVAWPSAAVAGASPTPAASAYTCSGGVIPAGTYSSLTVKGVCYAPAGNISVTGNVTVAPKALLDAITRGDPTDTPVVAATVTIAGNVTVGQGAVLLLGCSPNFACTGPPAVTYDRIGGNLSATNAQAVVLHSASVGGSVSDYGGGGGLAAQECEGQAKGTPVNPTLEPWSEDTTLSYTPETEFAFPLPPYTDVEDVTIHGNLTVSDVHTCWLGALRNQIGGTAQFTHDTTGDPDGMEVENNLVVANMACSNNTPAVHFGDSGAAPNIVGGAASGQCATTVNNKLQNGPVYKEVVSVKASTLGTYSGVYTPTEVGALTTVTTSSGDALTAILYDFTLTGTGLVGTGTVVTESGRTGAAELVTTYPNGSKQFTTYLHCASCTFHTAGGATKTVTLRFYGTVSTTGVVKGTFLVTSGGGGFFTATTTTTRINSIPDLVGYGTIVSGPSGTLHLTEHVGVAAFNTACLATPSAKAGVLKLGAFKEGFGKHTAVKTGTAKPKTTEDC